MDVHRDDGDHIPEAGHHTCNIHKVVVMTVLPEAKMIDIGLLPEVVMMTTYGATSGATVGIMTTLGFQHQMYCVVCYQQ